MVDAPTIARKAAPFDAVAFFRRYAALTGLIALLLFNFVWTPHFWSLQTLNVNLTQVATIVIVSVGMTLVIATGGIDLSVGSLMAIIGRARAADLSQSVRRANMRRSATVLAFVVPVGGRGAAGRRSTAGSSPGSGSSRSSARSSCSSPGAASGRC